MSADPAVAQPIRVLVVDDQALVRAGFRMIVEIEPDLEVVGEAADGEAAVAVAAEVSPDIVLMDVRMPGVDGIEATRRLLGADAGVGEAGGGDDDSGGGARVVMLTTFDMDQYVYAALRAGASGFLLKDVPPETLVAGIRAVHAGESLLAPVTRRMIEAFIERGPAGGGVASPAAAQRLSSLTTREREVLALVARGLTNAEIAGELFVSETTVKTHMGRVLMKLGLRDRVQAVIFAYESGMAARG